MHFDWLVVPGERPRPVDNRTGRARIYTAQMRAADLIWEPKATVLVSGPEGSRLDSNRHANLDDSEQIADVFVLERYTTPCPIGLRAIAVDVDIAAQRRLLRRPPLCPERAHNLVILRFCDQAIAQPAFGVRRIWITQTERQIKSAL